MSRLRHHVTPRDEHGRMLPAFATLAEEPIWLPWRVGPKRANGKDSKPPIRPDTGRGKEWQHGGVSYHNALSYAEANGMQGVGIIMGARASELGLVALDLDDALNADGKAETWARAIMRPVGSLESYTERSPSGQGFRGLAFGAGEGEGNSVEVRDGSEGARFVTITGRHVKDSPDSIEHAQATIAAALVRAGDAAQGEPEEGHQGEAVAVAAAAPAVGDDVPEADTIRSALAAVPAESLSYDEWLKVGQAINDRSGGSDAGLTIWDDWSAEDSGRYEPGDTEKRWAGFGKRKSGAKRVTIATLFQKAQAKGWTMPAGTVAAFGAVNDPDDPWPAAGSLKEAKLPPAGVVPPDVLPPMLTRFASDLAARIGADPTAVLAMVVPTMGAMVPGCVSFAVRGASGWTVPVTFFLALVGAPGSMKTPIISALAGPLEQREAEWRREHERRYATFKRDVDRAKAEKTGDLPTKPKRRRRSTTSATVEGHARLVENTGEAIITLTDELQTFFGSFDKFTGTGATGGTDRAYWLSAFDGRAYHSDRADEAKCISVDSVRASVIGGIQPPVLGAVLSSLATDGLAARFLYVPAGDRRLSLDVAVNSSRVAMYALACNFVLDSGQAGMGTPVVLTADADAKAVSFEAERFGLECMNALPENDPLRDIAAKAHGFVARLTAALHVIEWATAEAGEVSLGIQDEAEPLPLEVKGATAARALRLWRDLYWPNARRTYAVALQAAAAPDVDALARFISGLPATKSGFTATEAKAAVNRFKDRNALQSAADTLERAGWLRSEARKGGTVWTINPAVPRA